jgi:hypothetical protein
MSINLKKVLLYYCLLFFITANLQAQCTLIATSSSSTAGYTQVYVLVDTNGDIVAQNTTGTFTSLAVGSYTIHALNYDPSNVPAPLPSALIGQPIANVGTTTVGCYNSDFLTDYVTRVCATCQATTTVCETDPVVATSSGGNATYTQLYVLVNTGTGLVEATNATGTFTGMVAAANSYRVYALNYDPLSPPAPMPIVGQAVALVGTTISGCYNSDFLIDYACFNITSCATSCVNEYSVCENENITASSSGANLGYTQVYILTDDLGNFIAQNTTGIFSSVGFTLGDTYRVHALNYNPLNPPAPLPSVLAIGAGISTITGGCFNADFLTDYICFTIGCPCTGKLVQYSPDQGIAGAVGDKLYTMATAYCDDVSGWRYYYDPVAPADLLFAIEHKPAGGNSSDFTAQVTIGVNDYATTIGYDEPLSGQDLVNFEANFSMGRYWDVDVLSGTLNGNVNVRFYYKPAEYTTTNTAAAAWKTANEPAAIVAGYVGLAQLIPYWFKTNDNTAYDAVPDLATTTVNTGNILVLNDDYVGTNVAAITNNRNYVQFDNQISTFSGGTIAFRVTPVPIILDNAIVHFSGEKVGSTNQIHWTIDQEVEVADYVLMRSQNGIQSEELVRQSPLGQTTYLMTDVEPYIRTYYRLKVVQLNGTYNYTNWVVFERRAIDANTIRVYPNPAENDVAIDFWSDKKSTINFKIIDVLGRVLKNQQIEMTLGQNHYTLDLIDLPSAMYVLTIGDGVNQVVRKITKL